MRSNLLLNKTLQIVYFNCFVSVFCVLLSKVGKGWVMWSKRVILSLLVNKFN